ncbi:MAG: hypothetical protein M1831_005498 [Alyxoria varia]|nr:MAG: hypothetical protein M1831_005498 [Alyxoria varia]
MKPGILSMVCIAIASTTLALGGGKSSILDCFWGSKGISKKPCDNNAADTGADLKATENEDPLDDADIDVDAESSSEVSFNSEYEIRLDGFSWHALGDGDYYNEVDDSWVPEFLSALGDGCVPDNDMSRMLFPTPVDNEDDPYVYATRAGSPFSHVSIGLQVSAGTRRLALVELLRALLRPKQDAEMRGQPIRIPKPGYEHIEGTDPGEGSAILGGPWLGYRHYVVMARGQSPLPERFEGPMHIRLEITAALRPGHRKSIDIAVFRERQRLRREGKNGPSPGQHGAENTSAAKKTPPRDQFVDDSAQGLPNTFRRKPFTPDGGDQFVDDSVSGLHRRQRLHPLPKNRPTPGRGRSRNLPPVSEGEEGTGSVKGTFQGGSFLPYKDQFEDGSTYPLPACYQQGTSKMEQSLWVDAGKKTSP